jgi:hypothetical protein
MEELKLHDPYPLWYDARPLFMTALILALVLIALMAYGAVYFYRKYKKTKTYTAYERALNDLKELNAAMPRQWHVQVSGIIKNFLHHIYGMPTSLTDYEITVYIEQLKLNATDKEVLTQFFKQMVPAKFSPSGVAVQEDAIPHLQAILKGIWDTYIQQKRSSK